jgi:predicted secreted protein
MAGGFYGREVEFTWDTTPLTGIREKGLEINGEAANVTADDDAGIQALLDTDAELAHAINISGVSTTGADLFRYAKGTGDIQGTATLTYKNGYTISGTFNIGSFSEGLPYNGESTFQLTLNSTGVVTHTQGS